MRTALSQFSFAVVVLKIFTSEFYAIGALFAAYGAAVLLVAVYRRSEGNRQFFDREESEDESYSEEDTDNSQQQGNVGDGGTSNRRGRRRTVVLRNKFRTSGNSVAMLTVLSFGAYISLTALIWNLE
jgi:hypothetical protein